MQATFHHKPENMMTCLLFHSQLKTYGKIIQPALTSCCGFGDKLPANRILLVY